MNSENCDLQIKLISVQDHQLGHKALRKEGIYIVGNTNEMKLQLFNQDNKMNCLP